MKRYILLAVVLLCVMVMPAQGIYQLWGTTPAGGKDDMGVIFSTNNTGNNFQLRKQFSGSASIGSQPVFTVPVEYNGKLYGMTSSGGSFGMGVLFEWDPATSSYTKQFDFSGSNGNAPFGSLILKDGRFFGMTHSGGSNDNGVIFEWNPSTNVYTKKIDLNQSIGSWPYGSLTQFLFYFELCISHQCCAFVLLVC